jgi:hypothetical protein
MGSRAVAAFGWYVCAGLVGITLFTVVANALVLFSTVFTAGFGLASVRVMA